LGYGLEKPARRGCATGIRNTFLLKVGSVTFQQKKEMANQQQLFVSMTLSAWESYVKRTTLVFDGLSDAQLEHDIAPGRNSGIYLLGHLTAVHDAIPVFLGTGARLYAHLDAAFVSNPDKSGFAIPSVSDLRKYWKEVNARISQQVAKVPPDDWFARHTAVSEADFIKEPHRNKLNIIINRTGHLSYHLGQLMLLANKNG
jgi:hypothetical protein